MVPSYRRSAVKCFCLRLFIIYHGSTFGCRLDVMMLITFLLLLSGEPMKTNIRLEDGRIGEQPEVIYHVFHSLLFGGLALLFDG